MLGLDVHLKQTRFYQEIAEEERREGKLEGETQLLIRQLSKCFGPLPSWVQTKFAQADIEQLGLWSERILDANTLQAVVTPAAI
jgi:predicted transposase YdaD